MANESTNKYSDLNKLETDPFNNKQVIPPKFGIGGNLAPFIDQMDEFKRLASQEQTEPEKQPEKPEAVQIKTTFTGKEKEPNPYNTPLPPDTDETTFVHTEFGIAEIDKPSSEHSTSRRSSISALSWAEEMNIEEQRKAFADLQSPNPGSSASNAPSLRTPFGKSTANIGLGLVADNLGRKGFNSKEYEYITARVCKIIAETMTGNSRASLEDAIVATVKKVALDSATKEIARLKKRIAEQDDQIATLNNNMEKLTTQFHEFYTTVQNTQDTMLSIAKNYSDMASQVKEAHQGELIDIKSAVSTTSSQQRHLHDLTDALNNAPKRTPKLSPPKEEFVFKIIDF